MASTDIEINPSLRIGIESDGSMVRLTFFESDDKPLFGPIKLTRAVAQHIGKRLTELAS